MVIKDQISKAWPRKGKFHVYVYRIDTDDDSFGWVNASYVYGLQIVNAHMRRTLGTLTPWDQYKKATDTL